MVNIKRVYETPATADGYRVLVDRLWPRGLTREKAALDEWLKEIAPSPELREWFGHKPELFEEFHSRYEAELSKNPALDQLKAIVSGHDQVTLLYGAHDPVNNQAQVLLDYIKKHF